MHDTDQGAGVAGFVEKNADKLSRNLYALLAGAAEGRTRALFPPKSDAEAGKKASTVAVKTWT